MTTLNRLTREGAQCVTFEPALAPDQYAELQTAVDDVVTLQDLEIVVKSLASRWHRQVEIEPC